MASRLRAIPIVLCQDLWLQCGQVRIENGYQETIIILCTDSLQCTTSQHEWGVYCGVSGDGAGEQDAGPT